MHSCKGTLAKCHGKTPILNLHLFRGCCPQAIAAAIRQSVFPDMTCKIHVASCYAFAVCACHAALQAVGGQFQKIWPTLAINNHCFWSNDAEPMDPPPRPSDRKKLNSRRRKLLAASTGICKRQQRCRWQKGDRAGLELEAAGAVLWNCTWQAASTEGAILRNASWEKTPCGRRQ